MTVNRFEGTGRRARRWLLLAALACLIQPVSLEAAPRVVASIGPVASLAAAVMGDLGEPRQIVRGFRSPHAYQMRPSDAASLRDADLILWIGPSLETFLERPLAGVRDGTRVVALSTVPGLAMLPNRGAGVLEGDAHSGEQRGIGSYDPHVWLSPFNAKLMAGVIAEELSAIDPKNAATYQTNTDRLWQRVDAMEIRIASRLAPVRAVPFVVFHDAFQYFEESFGLTAVGSVTVGPDRMPSARRIKALREKIAESGARCVFREPQFESALVRVLLEDSDARASVIDPLGTAIAPGRDAYFELMNANTDALIDCLSG
jgi:zinc transport system substrate-binding protein